MKSPRRIFVILAIALLTLPAIAQRPVAYDSPQYEYKLAKELFQKADTTRQG